MIRIGSVMATLGACASSVAQLYTPGTAIAGASAAGTVNVGANTAYSSSRLNATGPTGSGNENTVYFKMDHSGGQNINLTLGTANDNTSSNGSNFGLWSEVGNASQTDTNSCAIRAIAYNGTGTGNYGTYGVWATAKSYASASGARTIGLRGDAFLNITGANKWIDGATATATVLTGAQGWTIFGSENEVSLNSSSTTTQATGATGSVYGSGTATTSYGLYGNVSGGSSTNSYGVYGTASNGTTKYGVYGIATGSGTTNYGLYGSASGATTNWAVYANGNQFSSSAATWTTSDIRLKKNIQPLTGSLAALMKLKPKTYTFDRTIHPGLNLPDGMQMGLISQEVEKVLPTLVMDVTTPEIHNAKGDLVEGSFDLKAMSYTGLIPVLIGGIQEQQAIIDDKQAQIDALTDRLNKLEARMNGDAKAAIAPGDATPRGAKLQQNEPNPFDGNTVIRYELPVGGKAGIAVRDADGKVVKEFAQLGTGNGQLMIAAGSLAAGTYTYSLLVDGQVIDTKRMVIAK